MKNIDSHLVYRFIAGETTTKENAEVEHWLNLSQENRQLLHELEQIWQNARPQNPENIPDIAAAWSEIQDNLNLGKTKSKARTLPIRSNTKPASHRWNGVLSIAATLIILIGGALLFRNFQNANQWQQVQTQNAQRMQLKLPDGSLVHLNNDSKIRYAANFLDSTRTVHLSGEAFFEVTHQKHAFIVKTDNARIKVLGTKFNIWARDEQTRVVVQDGRVALKNLDLLNKPDIFLTARQMSRCSRSSSPEMPTTVDLEKQLAWLQNRLVFEQTSLSEITKTLQRFYDVQIELANPKLGQISLTGTFHKKTIDRVLQSTCLTLGLNYRFLNGKYIISE